MRYKNIHIKITKKKGSILYGRTFWRSDKKADFYRLANETLSGNSSEPDFDSTVFNPENLRTEETYHAVLHR